MQNINSMSGQTVVITGASSGNGKAAALRFAQEGAHVVLAARREELLKDVAEECRKFGVKALAVPTDVTDFQQVKNLFQEALSLTGRVDVWVNNAGVLALGSFTETPPEMSEEILKINLLGCIYGAHVAIPHFIENERGVIITMNSLSAFIPTPYVAAYSASKMGLKGFTEALRFEMSKYKDIHVCDIYATFLDTTGLDHAANLTGKKVAPPPPVLDPCKVADVMVRLVKHPKNSVTLGMNAHLGKLVHFMAPGILGRGLAIATELLLKISPEERRTSGNIYHPVMEGKDIHGGWRALTYLKRLKKT